MQLRHKMKQRDKDQDIFLLQSLKSDNYITEIREKLNIAIIYNIQSVENIIATTKIRYNYGAIQSFKFPILR